MILAAQYAPAVSWRQGLWGWAAGVMILRADSICGWRRCIAALNLATCLTVVWVVLDGDRALYEERR